MMLKQFLIRIAKNDLGSTAIEYGLIASLVVIASIGAFEAVANENTGLWGVVSSQISTAMGDG